MEYWIDGYNFLFRVDPKRASLEERRRSLCTNLDQMTELLALSVILVFDGAEEHIPYATRHFFHKVEVVYTMKGQTADLYLLEVATRNKKIETTIVTSDKILAKQCREKGAKTLSIEAFIELLMKKLQKENTKVKESKPSAASQREIERYLKIFER